MSKNGETFPLGDGTGQAQLTRDLGVQKPQWFPQQSVTAGQQQAKNIWVLRTMEDLSYDGIFLSLADCFALFPSAICHV